MGIPVKFYLDDKNRTNYKINAEVTDIETLELVSNTGIIDTSNMKFKFTVQQGTALLRGETTIGFVEMWKLGYNRMDAIFGHPIYSRKANKKEMAESIEVYNRLLISDDPKFYDPCYAGGKADKGHGFWIQIGYKSVKEIKEMLGMNDI